MCDSRWLRRECGIARGWKGVSRRAGPRKEEHTLMQCSEGTGKLGDVGALEKRLGVFSWLRREGEEMVRKEKVTDKNMKMLA